MIDTSGQIDRVERGLGSEADLKVLTVSQVYDADLDDVWDALTNPERLPCWFLPISGELELEGQYQLEGNASGTITECDPPRRFAATWEFGGRVSWIEVRLSAEPDGRTRFTLQHSAHPDEHRATYGPGAVGIGWDMSVLGLAGHLGGAPAVAPTDAMAWMTSDDGRRFMVASGERWYSAHVAAGTDPATARAAADRTLAAYTAVEDPV